MTTHDLDNVIDDLKKTAPENIWLQIDHEANPVDGWEFKTWCEYEENDTDLEYIRADLVESLRQQLAAAQAKLNWNIEDTDSGFRVCRNLHDKGEGCEYEYYVPLSQLAEREKQVKILRNALEHHQSQTRPIQATIEALAATEPKP